MSLAEEADALTDSAQLPSKYQPHAEIDGDDGVAATGLVDGQLIGSDEDLLKLAHLDPKEWVVTNAKKQIWTKETANGTRRSIFFGFTRRTPERERMVELLASKIEPIKPVERDGEDDGLPLAVFLADLQLGKAQEKHGGTPELVQRFRNILGQVVDLVIEEHPSEILLADMGDFCESTGNHTRVSQVAQNDIPFAQQLRIARRMFTEAIISLAPYTDRMIVTGVPSNHMEERLPDGKQNGFADYGVENLKGIRDAMQLLDNDLDPEFVIPGPLDTGTFVRLGGLPIAMTHGHHAGRIDHVSDWLAQQAAIPDSIYAKCRTLVYAHYHHFEARVTRGRETYCCPTLENGSNWLFQKNAEYSEPGLLTFRIKDGKTANVRIFQEE